MLSLPAHVVPVAIAAALAVSLSGCVPTPASREPTVSPPRPTATPLFASDEEALAAAEEAYAAYSGMQQLISSENWTDPERIAPFVTEPYLEKELETAEKILASGLRLVGATEITSVSLQYFDSPDLVAYICHDVSDVRVLDEEGHDVTPIDRSDSNLLEVSFELVGDVFLVGGSRLWSEAC